MSGRQCGADIARTYPVAALISLEYSNFSRVCFAEAMFGYVFTLTKASCHSLNRKSLIWTYFFRSKHSGGMKMMLQVNGYALSYSIQTNAAQLFLHFTTNQQVPVVISSPEAFAALAEIMRTSTTVFYDPAAQVLSTPVKAPGTA